jgi:hypothetical protein
VIWNFIELINNVSEYVEKKKKKICKAMRWNVRFCGGSLFEANSSIIETD